MADLPVTPVTNFGTMLSAYGEGMANQENAATNRLNSQLSATQIPSQIQQRQAATALTGAQATGADIENQKAALMLQLTKNALQNYAESSDAAAAPKPGADNEGGSDTGGAASDEEGPPSPGGAAPANKSASNSKFKSDDESAAHIDQVLSDKFRVNAAFTPEELARFNAAIPLAIGGDHGMLDAAKTAHEIRVQNQLAQSQNGAQQAFDKMYAVTTAPDGTAWQALKGVSPNAAASFAKTHGLDPDHPEKWTAEEKQDLDATARKYAGMMHNGLFQYTGDKLEDKGGNIVNSRTGQKPIGDQTQGLTPQQWADKYKEATALDEIPDPAGGPNLKIAHWRNTGFPSPTAYVRGTAGPAAGAPGAPAGGAPGQTVGNKEQPVAGAGTSTTAVSKTGDTAPPTVGNLTQDPTLRKALADPEFKVQKSPAELSRPAGSIAGMSKQDEDRNKARTDLLSSAGDLTNASSQGLQYAKAAQAILEGKGAPTTGLYAPVLREISRVFPGGVTAANYQEVAKYLGNLSVQNFKQNFGSKPANAEFQIQMNVLNPNENMQPEAVRKLLQTNINNMQYGIDSGIRVNKFLASGGDPQKFHQWNEHYWPRAGVVNSPEQPSSTGATGSNSPTKANTGGPTAAAKPVQVKTRADALALKPGTVFITPDGRTLVR
jgi:hypothetical protein